MDVILHLGAHRCGTTTIQAVLARNHARLLAHQVEVWSPQRTRGGLFAGLLHPPEEMTPQIERRGNRALGLISIELERLEHAGRRAVLISEGNMIGNLVQSLRCRSLYPDARSRLMRVALGLGPRCNRIGIAIRAYDAFWASSLAFGVSTGHPMPGEQALALLAGQRRRWRHVIEDIAAAFPQADLTVWSSERFVSQPEVPLDHLMPWLDVASSFVGLRDWHNPSPRRNGLRQLLATRGAPSDRLALPPGEGRWMPFSAEQQAALRRDYAEDLAWLRGGAAGLARLVETAPPRVWRTSRPGDDTLLRADARSGWPEGARFEITGAETPGGFRRPSEETLRHERGKIVV